MATYYNSIFLNDEAEL